MRRSRCSMALGAPLASVVLFTSCSIVLDPDDLIGEGGGPTDGGPLTDGSHAEAVLDGAPADARGGDGGVARLRLQPRWVRTLRGPSVELARECAIDQDGNVTFVGRFQEGASLEDTALANAGGIDGLVARFDERGNELRVRTLGGPETVTLEGLSLVGSRTFITGRFNGDVDFGGGVRSAARFDTLVLALETSTLAWQWDAAGTGEEIGWGLAVDAGNGQVFVTGLFVRDHTFEGCAPVTGDDDSEQLFAARLDAASGECVWQRSFATNGQDRGQGIAAERSSDGFVAVAGRLEGLPRSAPTGFRTFLGTFTKGGGMPVDPIGLPFIPSDIAADDNGWCMVGRRDGDVVFDDGSEFMTMNADGFISCRQGSRLDMPRWSAAITGAGASGLRSIDYEAGRLVVVGDFGGELDLEGGTQTAEGARDGLLAVFDSSTGRRDVATVAATGAGDLLLYDVDIAGNRVCIAGEFRGALRVGSRELSSVDDSTDGFVAMYELSEQ